ncbi:MAG: lipase secretion chaperone [Cellvibrionaceae bacterium]
MNWKAKIANPRVIAGIIVVLVLVVTAAAIPWITENRSLRHEFDDRLADSTSDETNTDKSPQQTGQRTIATEWQWESVGNREAPTTEQAASSQATALFDITYIYDALRTVRLDDNGEVMLDDIALRSLDEALDHGNLELTSADLEELQELIRAGLPGEAGEQTAKIVGDYYRFLQAKKEFNAVYTAPGIENDYESEYEELRALRDLYLGRDVANQLFAETDRDARFMIRSMQLEADSSLSPEERQARQRKLAEDHYRPDIPRWEQRYSAFQKEKQHILDAGLTEEQQQEQIEQLLNSHFDTEEIAAVKRYDEIRSE